MERSPWEIVNSSLVLHSRQRGQRIILTAQVQNRQRNRQLDEGQDKLLVDSYKEWIQYINNHLGPGGLQQRAEVAASAVERIQSTTTGRDPVQMDLGQKMRRLVTLGGAGERLNPMEILDQIDGINMYLAQLDRSLLTPQDQAIIVQTESLMNEYLRATIMGPIDDNDLAFFHRQYEYRNSPEQQAMRTTTSVLARMGVAVVAVPLFLLFASKALFSKNGEGTTGAALWGIAAFAALMGPRLFDSNTTQWQREVGFLADRRGPQNASYPYPTLAADYGIAGQNWESVVTNLRSSASTAPLRQILEVRDRPYTQAEIKAVVAAIAPSNTGLAGQIETMMTGPAGDPGGHFRTFSGYVRGPTSLRGTEFMNAYIRQGAGPHMLSRLPTGNTGPAQQQPTL